MKFIFSIVVEASGMLCHLILLYILKQHTSRSCFERIEQKEQSLWHGTELHDLIVL
jgi:hypothetical protein